MRTILICVYYGTFYKWIQVLSDAIIAIDSGPQKQDMTPCNPAQIIAKKTMLSHVSIGLSAVERIPRFHAQVLKAVNHACVFAIAHRHGPTGKAVNHSLRTKHQ